MRALFLHGSFQETLNEVGLYKGIFIFIVANK